MGTQHFHTSTSIKPPLTNRDSDNSKRYDVIAEVARKLSLQRAMEKQAVFPELEPDNSKEESFSFRRELLD